MDSSVAVERTANDLTPNYEYDSRWKPQLSWSFLSWSQQHKMEQQAAQRELAWQKIADKLGPLLMADAAWSLANKETIYAGNLDTMANSDEVQAQIKAQERVPIISHQYNSNNNNNNSHNNNFNYQTNRQTSKLNRHSNHNANYSSNTNNNIPSTLLNTPPDSTRSGSRFKDNIIISFQSSHEDNDESKTREANYKRENHERNHGRIKRKFDYDFRGKGRFLTVSGTIILLIIILFSILILMALGILPHNMRYH